MQKNSLNIYRALFKKNVNITEYLKKERSFLNSSEIIEIAYDLQTGSYIDSAEKNEAFMRQYADWTSDIVARFTGCESKSILDAGTGEITTFSYVLEALSDKDIDVIPYCFDISWSRIYAGKAWIRKRFPKNRPVNAFCGDLLHIPFHSNSIDVVITSHAVEPNGGKETEILTELLRVSRKWLVLCEPSYENNSSEGKKRMDSLGYVKGLPEVIKSSGAKLIDVIPFDHSMNPLNPTHAYIIEVPKHPCTNQFTDVTFTVPGTDWILDRHDDCYYSKDQGLSYPILSDIPILKNESAILSSYKNLALYEKEK
jgi:SAM-dependent methyltransferase